MSLQDHTFGVEFEALFPRETFATIARRLTEISGIAISQGARVGDANTGWRIVQDSSVQGAGQSGEIVSPVLQGEEGFQQVRQICAALVSFGATVNQSCGFHVHVGAGRADLTFFKNLVKLYRQFEPAIDSIMTPSRRGDSNPYCRSLAVANIARVDAASTLPQLIEAQTAISNNAPSLTRYRQRFMKLNLRSFEKHRTVEFRQHSGTTDGDKAVQWIKTCIRIVAAAKSGKTAAPQAAPGSFEHLPRKTRRSAEMISRPEGATRLEIMADLGLNSLAVRRQARLAGITLREVRQNGQDRFFAATVSTSGAVAFDLPTLATLIESSADESAYLISRAATLAR